MKYIQQFLIIILISVFGEVLNFLLPFPIPGNIYGMVLMFFLLMNGCIQLHQVKDVSRFLLDIMPILFIPSAVGIMTKIEVIRSMWWQLIIIIIVTTLLVIVISGLVTQIIIRRSKSHGESEKTFLEKGGV